MTHSTIYDMSTCDILADGVQSQRVCDATVDTARQIARDMKRSVVVEDYGAQECYRVTPAGHLWRAPKWWDLPSWSGEPDNYETVP